jgi:hypothetical protein
MDWIQLPQDRDQWWVLVNTVMDLHIPYKAGNFFTSGVSIIFTRRTLIHNVSE